MLFFCACKMFFLVFAKSISYCSAAVAIHGVGQVLSFEFCFDVHLFSQLPEGITKEENIFLHSTTAAGIRDVRKT